MGPPPVPQPSREAQPQRDLNFKVLKFLGKGSYGSVFQVQRLSDGQQYALKEMDVKAMSQAEREDAANEIRLLASVASPHIIAYNEAFLDGNRLCIIMEFASDGDLAKVIKKHQAAKKPLPEDLIWKYFIQVARGLRVLHNMQILHRDIKPGNVMIMTGDVAKIGDLGISKLLKHTMAKTQIGTPHYMPPEVWKNRPYGLSSDSWALGCILYEMATFTVPFEAKSMSELRYKVLRGSYPPLPASYSRDLHQMVRECMDLNPDRRPTMEAILHSDAVQRRMGLLPQEPRAAPPSTAGSVMLSTIKVPKNFQLIKGKLPGPAYPGMMDMATVTEEEDDDLWYPPEARQAQKLPPLGGGGGGNGGGGGGGNRRAPPPLLPPQLQPKPGGQGAGRSSIAQLGYNAPVSNYGPPAAKQAPLPQHSPRGGYYDPRDAQGDQYYDRPRLPPPPPMPVLASIAKRDQQQQQQQQPTQQQAANWPPKGGVSESHSAYGAFYQQPARGNGGNGDVSDRYRQPGAEYGGKGYGVPVKAGNSNWNGGGGAVAVVGGGAGGFKLPAIGGPVRSQNGEGGAGGWAPPPWNFAAGKAAQKAAQGHARNAANGGGGGGVGGAHNNAGVSRYPPPQWAAPKASRW